MAARSHSTAVRHSMGNLTLSIISFTDIDNGDTYTSNVPAAVSYWANGTDNATRNLEKVNVAYAAASAGQPNAGIFTFGTAEDNRAVDLYILSRT